MLNQNKTMNDETQPPTERPLHWALRPEEIAELRRQEGVVPKRAGEVAIQAVAETAPMQAAVQPTQEVSMPSAAESDFGRTIPPEEMRALRAQLAQEERFRPPVD